MIPKISARLSEYWSTIKWENEIMVRLFGISGQKGHFWQGKKFYPSNLLDAMYDLPWIDFVLLLGHLNT